MNGLMGEYDNENIELCQIRSSTFGIGLRTRTYRKVRGTNQNPLSKTKLERIVPFDYVIRGGNASHRFVTLRLHRQQSFNKKLTNNYIKTLEFYFIFHTHIHTNDDCG